MMRKTIGGWLVLGFLLVATVAAGEPMLPEVYRNQVDVTGWVMSEKLDGVRGYWDGRQLWSKNGHPFAPPAEFVRDWPSFPLEGELWAGRGQFATVASIVRSENRKERWLQLRFAIFDAPEAGGSFAARINQAREWFAAHPGGHAFVIEQIPVQSEQHLQQELRRVEVLGGEGLIVRRADTSYAPGRSPTILKVKSYLDAEATVIAHRPGKGRNLGRLGALLVRMDDGTEFRIGSGFSDAERDQPPPPGTLITFKYYGRFASGIPRFPSFLRVREDNGL